MGLPLPSAGEAVVQLLVYTLVEDYLSYWIHTDWGLRDDPPRPPRGHSAHGVQLPTKLIPFYGGAEFHDYHHYVGRQSKSYFSSVFTYCDYIYGTDKVGLCFLTTNIYGHTLYNFSHRFAYRNCCFRDTNTTRQT
ncbi:hypothetical protein C2845_PM14G05080 [Panicum miliaceum]|uniref:Uncharacterized protein n=1 Tax=Panicum miliaceum TaxID=4540 RepID=A0A3L6PRY9_PANMI|nr:hypothetical protein C2845_PM14G05080 [Panicum miliaceum]